MLRVHAGSRPASAALRTPPVRSRRPSNSSALTPEAVLEHLGHRVWANRVVVPVFRAFDDDKTGKLSYDLFVRAVRRLGVGSASTDVLYDVARRVDRAGAGEINYVEFAAELSNSCQEEGYFPSELREALKNARARSPEHRKASVSSAPKSPPQAWVEPAAEAEGEASEGARDGSAGSAGSARSECDPPPPVDPAVLAAEMEAKRVAAEALAVHQVLQEMRLKMTSAGAIAKVFGLTTGDSLVKTKDVSNALVRLNIHPQPGVLDRLCAELGFKADTDGLGYRVFVGNLFQRFGEAKQAEASRHLVGGGRAPTDLAQPSERLAAAAAADELKRSLRARELAVGDALRAVGLDSGGAASYDEFESFVRCQLPHVDRPTAAALCRLFDGKADGVVDVKAFAQMAEATHDRLHEHSAVATTRRLEKQAMLTSQGAIGGRYGATPALSYGLQAKELMIGCPGTPGYLSTAERLQRSYGAATVHPWQCSDAARRSRLINARHEAVRAHKRREAASVARFDGESARLAEARLESLFRQKTRYLTSVAYEERSRLK